MSKGLLRKKLFSQEMLNSESNRIERIRMYILEPEKLELNHQDWAHLEKLRSAFIAISDSISKSESIRKLKDLFPYEKNEVLYKIINDTQEIFGGIIESNKKWDRDVMVEKLSRLAEKAENGEKVNIDGIEVYISEPDLHLAHKCLETIAKVKLLDKEDQQDEDPDRFKLPDIIFSSDVSLLKASEDIEIVENE